MTTSTAMPDHPMRGEKSVPAELARRVSPGTRIRSGESLAGHTTLRVGGPADFYVEPESERDLAAVLKYFASQSIPVFLLGRGSNLLVGDAGWRGAVICLAQPQFAGVRLAAACLECGAGARLKRVAIEARRHGIAGFEFLEGIPGSVGGALRMNAGAMGGAVFDLVRSVRLMDFNGNIREASPGELSVEYRRCAALEKEIALAAVLGGKPDEPEAIGKRMLAFSQKRWASQPATPSAGCIFKNPSAMPAGKLIEELGLKGARVGGAAISTEHGNFIVNEGSATAADVFALIDLVRRRAKDERGIELQIEVEILGDER